MWLRSMILAMAALVSTAVGLSEKVSAQPPPPSSKEDKAKDPSNPTRPNPPDRMRQPGFIFVELFTQDLSGYTDFFQTVTEFKLNRKEETFVQLRSERSEILLNSTKDFSTGHPFRGKVPNRGEVVVVEIGILVGDLDKAYAAVRKFKEWKIVAGITRQPWGPRDFRVLSPDGYYLRFTEPAP